MTQDDAIREQIVRMDAQIRNTRTRIADALYTMNAEQAALQELRDRRAVLARSLHQP